MTDTRTLYGRLRGARPNNIKDLWRNIDNHLTWFDKFQLGRRGDFDSCKLAAYLDVWATDDEINELLQDEVEMAALVRTFAAAAKCNINFINDHHHLNNHFVFLSSCKGCNRNFDEENRDFDDYPYHDLPSDEVEIEIHVMITTMRVINHLMARKDNVDNLLKAFKDKPVVDDKTVLDILVLVVNKCFFTIPALGLEAATTISFFAARWPARCFDLLSDASTLIPCLRRYMELLMELICIYDYRPQLDWAVVSFLRIIPLLYRMGSWKLIWRHANEVEVHQLSSYIYSFAGIIRDTIGSEDYLQCCSCPTLVDSILTTPLKRDKDRKWIYVPSPDTPAYAVTSALEILAIWNEMGLLNHESICIQECDYESFESYIDDNEHYHLDYLRDIISNLSNIEPNQGVKKDHDDNLRTQFLLLKPMKQANMKCGLWECRSRKKLLACSGCDGLEHYCCREHQKKDWKVHKKFCMRELVKR